MRQRLLHHFVTHTEQRDFPDFLAFIYILHPYRQAFISMLRQFQIQLSEFFPASLLKHFICHIIYAAGRLVPFHPVPCLI